MSSFHQRQGNTAGTEKLVVKLTETKFTPQSLFFPVAETIDYGPAQSVSHRYGRRLAVPVQISAGLRARKVELAHHQVGRLVVGHSTGLRFDIDDDSEGSPEPVLQHDEAVLFGFQKTLFLHQLFAVKRPA